MLSCNTSTIINTAINKMPRPMPSCAATVDDGSPKKQIKGRFNGNSYRSLSMSHVYWLVL